MYSTNFRSQWYVYSSRTREWKLLRSIDPHISVCAGFNSRSYCLNGKAYVMALDCNSAENIIVVFNIEDECLSLIKTPAADQFESLIWAGWRGKFLVWKYED